MPGEDETDPGFKPVDKPYRLLHKNMESAISELPNEFGVFDNTDHLVAASGALIERCDLQENPLVSNTLKETFRRLAAQIATFNGKQVQESDLLEQSIFGQLKSSSDKAVEVEFSDGAWRLLYFFPISTGGHILQCVDVTSKKEMEASVRRSTDVVRRVLEACPFALVMARLSDLSIIYESPANNEMFGEAENTKADHIGVYDVDPSRRHEYLERLCKHGFVNNFEMQFRGRDDKEFVAALSGRIIEFEGEQVIVSGAVDLTERQAVEKELAQQREALFQSEKLRALGELLAGISHELNNPLSVLVGHSQLLKETTSDPKVAHRVQKISNAADRCARIVKSFLTMARQQSAKREPVDMNKVIQFALDVTGYSLRSAGIDLKLDMAKELPMVSGDSDQLGQVMTNLVINAQHALGEIEGPRILRLETSHCAFGDQVVVNVEDNGPGIPQEHINRIFEPLFTTKDGSGGTGIGLALCHRVIESHGGAIVVQSRLGHRTVFTIRLPVMRGEKSASKTKKDFEVEMDIRGLRILVIDDDSDVTGLIRDILNCDGYICETANSGREALQLLDSTRFDVILSDIRMPEMGGQTLYSVISGKFPDLIDKVGFITGDNLNQESHTFLRKVQRPYIEKPITSNDVRSLIKRICAS